MAIYLDYNAGAPPRPETRDAINAYLSDPHGNPSSVHRAGQHARRMLEQARAQVARLIQASPRELVFTSGGTEANNLAIFGAVRASLRRRSVISSQIEHSSIMAPLARLEAEGFDVIRIASDGDGRIAPDRVVAALDDNTALVTLGLANSEVGTIQDLRPLAKPIREAGALFHVDAAQAAGRMPVSARELACDLMTLSGHKLGAPSGSGALFNREGIAFIPWMLGGPQEGGLRAGTPNLIGAIAFGAAAAAVESRLDTETELYHRLADRLLELLAASIPGIRFNGPRDGRIPNTLNLTFPRVLGESLLIALDLDGVEVSMGSACAAGAVEPSHVLLAMGRSVAEARSSLRLSVGWASTSAEIERAAEIIACVWRTVAAAESGAAEVVG